jgi:lysophospholipase L1-like esterase
MPRAWSAIFVLCCAPALAGEKVYLSLGDSLAFGYTTVATSTEPSFGDRGYVAPYADWLATRDGGVRPKVVNLGITGESTASFFDTSNAARAVNLTYGGMSLSQSAKLAQVVSDEGALGNAIETVSVALGANDIFQVVLQPGFIDLPGAQQLGAIFAALQSALDNYTLAMTQVRSLLPEADLLIIGQYNPFAAVPESPASAFAPLIVDALNQINTNVASAFGGRYIDTFSAFAGNEAVYTQILLDGPPGSNPHPTPAGYAAIAAAMIPAPSSAVVLVGLIVGVRRRRAA